MRFAILALLFVTRTTLYAATHTGRTVRVTDGDAIVILSEGYIQHQVRLQGLDAPERGQAYGCQAGRERN